MLDGSSRRRRAVINGSHHAGPDGAFLPAVGFRGRARAVPTGGIVDLPSVYARWIISIPHVLIVVADGFSLAYLVPLRETESVPTPVIVTTVTIPPTEP